MKIKKTVMLLLLCVLLGMTSACAAKQEKEDSYDLDYFVLVNKLNPLPDDWETKVRTEHCTNTLGDDVEVETKAYQAYLELKKELEAEDIHVDLDSARRTIEAQQKIMDDFTEKYGADYAAKIVAKPGYSEHHTGLALDLYLIVDGQDIVENEDLVQYPEIWASIHEKLARHGFILRYLEDKEHITGYAYEPWHIRYIDDPEKAALIMRDGCTLEGFLGAVKETEPLIDLGSSKLFTEEELKEMAILIKCNFAAWKDCELKSLTYDGDGEDPQTAAFLMDLHTSKEGYGDLPGDSDITGLVWNLGLDEEGDWQINSWGE